MSNSSENKRAAEALNRAADLLQETGWCRGAEKNESGHYCAIGVIQAVAPRSPSLQTTMKELLLEEANRGRDNAHQQYSSIPGWNDDLPSWGGRTVIRAMRRAARRVLGQ